MTITELLAALAAHPHRNLPNQPPLTTIVATEVLRVKADHGTDSGAPCYLTEPVNT